MIIFKDLSVDASRQNTQDAPPPKLPEATSTLVPDHKFLLPKIPFFDGV